MMRMVSKALMLGASQPCGAEGLRQNLQKEEVMRELNAAEINQVDGGNILVTIVRWVASNLAWEATVHTASNIDGSDAPDMGEYHNNLPAGVQ